MERDQRSIILDCLLSHAQSAQRQPLRPTNQSKDKSSTSTEDTGNAEVAHLLEMPE